MRAGRRLAAAFAAALTLSASIPALADEAGSSKAGSTTEAAVSALPEPYRADEFPPWMRRLRRMEIISLGAFPIILFYTRFAFDTKRFLESGLGGDGFDAALAPWPFKSEDSYEPSDEEQLSSVAVAGVLSLAFGLADALLTARQAPR